MPDWALQLGSTEIEPIGMLWDVPGVSALSHAGHVWLKGQEVDVESRSLLASIPCMCRFEVLSDGALLKHGQRVPLGFLPTGTWQPLHSFLTVTLPPSSLPASRLPRVPVRLVPSSQISEPDVLLTALTEWVRYVETAPQVRIRPCQFAIARDGRTLVWGRPLPPLAGTRAVARSGLVVPCGWNWAPEVDSSLLATAWGVESGDLWLMWPGRPIERIAADQLVPANRAAVRQSWEAIQHVNAQ